MTSWKSVLAFEENIPSNEINQCKLILKNYESFKTALDRGARYFCLEGDHEHVTCVVHCPYVVENWLGKVVEYGEVFDEIVSCPNHHNAAVFERELDEILEWLQVNASIDEEIKSNFTPQEIELLSRL